MFIFISLCTNDIHTYITNHNKDILHNISYNEVYNAQVSYTNNSHEPTIM